MTTRLPLPPAFCRCRLDCIILSETMFFHVLFAQRKQKEAFWSQIWVNLLCLSDFDETWNICYMEHGEKISAIKKIGINFDHRVAFIEYSLCKSIKPLYKLAAIARASFSARLSSLIIPALQERQCLQTTIFMQDEATPCIGCQVKSLLGANFGDNRDYPYIFRIHGLLPHPT
ncbi:hypothetical protein TNCV_773601 [Trichonephila clavipes]|nr:hypothetical protein TNCV_773601 [Trichonephila clavipes]